MTDDAVVPEPEPQQPPTRRGRRAVLWAVVAVLAAAIGAVAVVAGGGDGDQTGTRRLPVALGSSGGAATAEGRAAGPAADMAMMAYVHHSAGEDLPALGGDGHAYRLRGGVDVDALRKVAGALGLSGEPARDPDAKDQWTVRDGDRALMASEYGGGSWWYSSSSPQVDRGASDGSTGSGASSASGTAEVDPVPPDCAPDDKCIDPMPVTTTVFVPPADLPSRDEAEQMARDLFASIGVDVRDAEVTVDGPYDSWYVNVSPKVDGLVVSGLGFSAGIGSKGEILSASGLLAAPEALGTYPTIDTRAAIDRLNDGSAYGYGAGGREHAVDAADAADAPQAAEPPIACAEATDLASDGGPEPAIAPAPGCTPPEPVEPIEVVLHRAERILILLPASDGSTDSYLVPGYRLSGDEEGQVVEVPAIVGEAILPAGGAEPAGQ